MTQYLPEPLLGLFDVKELPYLPPTNNDPNDRRACSYTGVASMKHILIQQNEKLKESPPETSMTREQRRQKKLKDKKEQAIKTLQKNTETWDPSKDEQVSGDPYKTLFVSRISYGTTESSLKEVFKVFGSIKRIRIVVDSEGKSRGYAFIEFEHEKDMRRAYKEADAIKIDNKRVIVDVERGRTVKGWLPRRLGGGLGGTRLGADKINVKSTFRVSYGNLEQYKQAKEREEKDRDRHGHSPSRDRGYRGSGYSSSSSRYRDSGDSYERKRSRERDSGRDHDRSRNSDRSRDHHRRSRDPERPRDARYSEERRDDRDRYH